MQIQSGEGHSQCLLPANRFIEVIMELEFEQDSTERNEGVQGFVRKDELLNGPCLCGEFG